MTFWRALVQQQLNNHNVVTRRQYNKNIMSRAKRTCVTTELLCYDLTKMLVSDQIRSDR